MRPGRETGMLVTAQEDHMKLAIRKVLNVSVSTAVIVALAASLMYAAGHFGAVPY